MFRKLAAIVNHPYAAPVTETFKGILGIARAPINGFIESVQKGWDDEEYRYDDEARAKPKFVRVFREIFDGYADLGTSLTAFAGALAGGGGLAFAAGAAAYGGGIGWTVAAAAGLGVGVAAGPFVLAGAIGLAAAAVGSVVGGVPGFFRGVGKVLDYRRNRAAYDQAMQDLPAQAEKEALAKRVAPALAEFNSLAQQDREPFVRMMVEDYAQAFHGRSEQLAKQIEALPDYERKRLAESLKDKLKDAFTAAPPAPAVPASAPDEDDVDGIVVPRTASFTRHQNKKAAVTP